MEQATQQSLFDEERLPPRTFTAEQTAAAAVIRRLVDSPDPAGKLLKYALAVASDEFIANEYYQTYPELMSFLVQAGTTDEEILFRDYVYRHQEVLYCRKKGCHGHLQGGCPVMVCDTCGTKHNLVIDHISDLVCTRCAAQKLKECSHDLREKLHRIFCTNPEAVPSYGI